MQAQQPLWDPSAHTITAAIATIPLKTPSESANRTDRSTAPPSPLLPRITPGHVPGDQRDREPDLQSREYLRHPSRKADSSGQPSPLVPGLPADHTKLAASAPARPPAARQRSLQRAGARRQNAERRSSPPSRRCAPRRRHDAEDHGPRRGPLRSDKRDAPGNGKEGRMRSG